MPTLQDRDIKKINTELKDLRKELDQLGRQLDKIDNNDIELEVKSLLIRNQMISIWETIQKLKKQ